MPITIAPAAPDMPGFIGGIFIPRPMDPPPPIGPGGIVIPPAPAAPAGPRPAMPDPPGLAPPPLQASAITARAESDKVGTLARGMGSPFTRTVAAAQDRLGKSRT
jgi:hypothetical protein